MMGYQAAESAPIVVGHPIDDPHTVATRDQDWQSCELERRDQCARRIGRRD